jgi:DnaJ-class molecular chaperone
MEPSMTEQPNHYETLGVSADASPVAIQDAYRRLSLKYHPDRQTGDVEAQKLINEAYEVLSDPELRSEYDSGGAEYVAMITGMTADLLSKAVEKDLEGVRLKDLVEHAVQAVTGLITRNSQAISANAKRKERLEQMRGRVETTDAVNLFELMLLKSIEDTTQNLESRMVDQQVYEAIKARLERYKDKAASIIDLTFPTPSSFRK